MSTKYQTTSEVPMPVLIRRLQQLGDAILKQNKDEFSMRVPAECDRDADLVIPEAARRLEQLREKEARIARLEKCLIERDGGAHDADCKAYTRKDESLCKCGHNYTTKVLKESPQQSLAAIQADAVEQFIADLESFNTMREANGREPYTPDEYAQQLREADK